MIVLRLALLPFRLACWLAFGLVLRLVVMGVIGVFVGVTLWLTQ